MVETKLVQAGELQACVQGILVGNNLTSEDATTVAATLVEADLRGVHSHGVMRIPLYLGWLKSGHTAVRPEIRMVRDEGPQAVIDAGRSMGQVVAVAAMREAIKRAGQYGIGAVGVRNSTHCGAMAYYAKMALESNCIGYASTTAGINMAPWGGRQKLVGNNPFAFAAPTPRPWPFVLDMATSVVAGGKVDMAKIRGQKIPFGWGVDEDGNPTDDPNLVRALLPVGGAKGYGLALVLDILSGLLTGGRFGAHLGVGSDGHFFLAIDIERYMPVSEFLDRMEQLIAQIHACPVTPGVDRIYVPGEIEHNLEQERLQSGIPIEVTTLQKLDDLARGVGAPTLLAGTI